MFRSGYHFPIETTGDPVRDGDLEKARREASAPIGLALALAAFCLLVMSGLIWPHTTAMFVGKILNAFIAIAHS